MPMYSPFLSMTEDSLALAVKPSPAATKYLNVLPTAIHEDMMHPVEVGISSAHLQLGLVLRLRRFVPPPRQEGFNVKVIIRAHSPAFEMNAKNALVFNACNLVPLAPRSSDMFEVLPPAATRHLINCTVLSLREEISMKEGKSTADIVVRLCVSIQRRDRDDVFMRCFDSQEIMVDKACRTTFINRKDSVTKPLLPPTVDKALFDIWWRRPDYIAQTNSRGILNVGDFLIRHSDQTPWILRDFDNYNYARRLPVTVRRYAESEGKSDLLLWQDINDFEVIESFSSKHRHAHLHLHARVHFRRPGKFNGWRNGVVWGTPSSRGDFVLIASDFKKPVGNLIGKAAFEPRQVSRMPVRDVILDRAAMGAPVRWARHTDDTTFFHVTLHDKSQDYAVLYKITPISEPGQANSKQPLKSYVTEHYMLMD